MRHILAVLLLGGLTVGGLLLLPMQANGSPDDEWQALVGRGGGHDPVTLCHWVPAHGGSFVTITVDDDGADGNSQLQAHLGHPNDIIPTPEEGCGAVVAPTVTPTPSEIGTPTPTSFTPDTTPCVEDEVYDSVAGECIHIDSILSAPVDTVPVKLPSTGIGAK